MAVTRLDFVAHGARPALWRRVLLAGGVLALASACLNAALQARRVAQLEESIAAAGPRAAVRAALPVEQQRSLAQQESAVADAVRQLNLPVARLIRTVRAPQGMRVALLGLELANKPEPGTPAIGLSGALKISAEAETAQDMMNYVAYLNAQPLFATVYLVKHEMAAGPGTAYRFELEAVWKE